MTEQNFCEDPVERTVSIRVEKSDKAMNDRLPAISH